MAKNSMRIGVTLRGFNELQGLMRDLPPAVQTRVMAIAVKKAAAPIVSIARQKAPKDSGALKRSITSVVRSYKKTGRTLAIIGPDTDLYTASGKKAKKGERGFRRPSKYAHLVEFGHHSATATGFSAKSSAGTSTRKKGNFPQRSFIMPQPFLRPAVMSGQGAAATALEDGVEAGIAREITRLHKKISKA